MRRTKIICTIGPAVDNEETLKKMMLAGMDCARLNFSHGTYEEQQERINMIKQAREDLNLPVAILLDTKGPEIRVENFKDGSVVLEKGQQFTLDTNSDVPGDATRISLTFKNLAASVKAGDQILIDDGKIGLYVKEIKGDAIVCEVTNGGKVSDHKSINVPNVAVDMPYLSAKDKKDILFGIENGVDYIAASFARTADDIRQLRGFLEGNDGGYIRVISKIENKQGVENVDAIMKECEGIMVARGDLGVEIPFKEIPVIQKSIIKKCNHAGKIVVTATQMLESMTGNPRPTRAEVSDVANAVYDGTTVVMLSGETAAGQYPLEAVTAMADIVKRAEAEIDYGSILENGEVGIHHTVRNAICSSACRAATYMNAKLIVSATVSGSTARRLSYFRPSCPVLAPTVDPQGMRHLALEWGVRPVAEQALDNISDIIPSTLQKAKESGLAEEGDTVIVTLSSSLTKSGGTDTMRICTIQ